jgi:hypothetical protein
MPTIPPKARQTERQINAWERDENLSEFRLLSQHLGDEILRQQGELLSFAELAAAVMAGPNPVDSYPEY